MNNYIVELNNLGKNFGRRLVFNGIDYSFTSGNVYGISGPNGSGKSTFVKIIAGLISPTSGKVNHSYLNKIIEPEKLHDFIGFVSPYLFLYDEFTAEENLIYFTSIRGLKYDSNRADFLLNEMSLFNRRKDLDAGIFFRNEAKNEIYFCFIASAQAVNSG